MRRVVVPRNVLFGSRGGEGDGAVDGRAGRGRRRGGPRRRGVRAAALIKRDGTLGRGGSVVSRSASVVTRTRTQRPAESEREREKERE